MHHHHHHNHLDWNIGHAVSVAKVTRIEEHLQVDQKQLKVADHTRRLVSKVRSWVLCVSTSAQTTLECDIGKYERHLPCELPVTEGTGALCHW